MDEEKQRRRQEEFRRFDLWLQRLNREHPVRYGVLLFGLCIGIFLVAMILKQFFAWMSR